MGDWGPVTQIVTFFDLVKNAFFAFPVNLGEAEGFDSLQAYVELQAFRPHEGLSLIHI